MYSAILDKYKLHAEKKLVLRVDWWPAPLILYSTAHPAPFSFRRYVREFF